MRPRVQFSIKQLFRWTLLASVVLATWIYLPIDDLGARFAVLAVLAADFYALSVFFRSSVAVRVKIAVTVAIAAVPLGIAVISAAPDWFVGLASYCSLLAVVGASLAGIWHGRGRLRAFSIGCILPAILFVIGETILIRVDWGWYGFQHAFGEVGGFDLVVVAQLVPPAAGGVMMAVYLLIGRCLKFCRGDLNAAQ